MSIFKRYFSYRSVSRLWKDFIIERLTANSSQSQLKRGHDIYASNNTLMSGTDNVTYLYTLDGVSASVKMYWKELFRDAAGDGVKVNFFERLQPDYIDWNSPKVKSKRSSWRNVMSEREGVNAFNFSDNMDSMSEDQWRLMSLIYLPMSESMGVKLFKFQMLMTISGKRGDAFDTSVEKILKIANTNGINLKFTRVMENLPDYVSSYSPFSNGFRDKVKKGTGRVSLTDHIITRFDPMTQGKIGKKGTMMGIDVYSRFPVFKQFKRHISDAEIILVTAMTGAGKSFMVKSIISQFCGNDKYRITINDIEGFEYLYLAQFVANDQKVEIVNMSKGEGNYFDSTEIYISGISSIDKNAYELATSFTESLFKVLIGSVVENEWAEDIISDALALTYSSRGVQVDDMSTWGRSKGLTYWDVYATLKETYIALGTEDSDVDGINRFRKNESYIDAYDKVMAKLRRYFETMQNGGTSSSLFKRRISLEDIKDAKMVVNSFGMAGKDEKAMSSIGIALAQLYSSYITQIRSLYCQAEGKFNVKVYEEFQRWGKFKGSESTINTAVTGGRKMGDIVFIVTNVLRELIDKNNFNILDNITSCMIGVINDADTRKDICSKLSMMQMLPELDNIALKASSKGTEAGDDLLSLSPYKKAFVANFDREVATTLRAELPPYISDSKLFLTAVEEQKEFIESQKDLEDEYYDEVIEYSEG